jgi:hypothetical protein
LRALAGADQDLTHISRQSDTDDQRRAGLTRVLKMGLLRYVAQTPLAQRTRVGLSYTFGSIYNNVINHRF